MKPCSVVFVSAALDLSEKEIMQAIKNEQLMATGGRSPRTAKVLPSDVAQAFGVDVAKAFDLPVCLGCGKPLAEGAGG